MEARQAQEEPPVLSVVSDLSDGGPERTNAHSGLISSQSWQSFLPLRSQTPGIQRSGFTLARGPVISTSAISEPKVIQLVPVVLTLLF